jgi:hypothetical protein
MNNKKWPYLPERIKVKITKWVKCTQVQAIGNQPTNQEAG